MKLRYSITTVLGLLIAAPIARAAELAVSGLAMKPGASSSVIVSGAIDGDATIGVTIMLELVPRHGNTGSVQFTRSLVEADLGASRIRYPSGRSATSMTIALTSLGDTDITALRDPWPRVGSNTVYDTAHTGSPRLNGMVDDNGTFLPTPLQFTGSLAGFPIKASDDAAGTWDVLLSTSAGESTWEGVTTLLRAGTVTVTAKACAADVDCDDADGCTLDKCEGGRCVHERDAGKCLERAETEEARLDDAAAAGKKRRPVEPNDD